LGFLAIVAPARAAEPELNHRAGQVTTPDGKPIAGASIRVLGASASAREGQVCPTALAGVGKTYTSDAQGRYELVDLDPRLKYELTVTAAGHKAHVIENLSGAVTTPITTKLKPQDAEIDQTAAVTGRVLDDDGKPLAGAVVEIYGEAKGTGQGASEQFGGITNVDPWAVTDAEGKFVLAAKGEHRHFFTRVFAQGFATQAVRMDGGNVDTTDNNEVRLTRGCTVTGRLVKDGQPLAGVEMRLSQQDRNAERFTQNYSVGTDADGKFTFEHVPETDDYFVGAAIESLGSRGATGAVKIKTGANAATPTDVGDVVVGPAVTIRGTVVLPEGVKSAKGLTLWVGPMDQFDGARGEVGEDGAFKISGIPAGVVTLRVVGRTLGLSPENASYFEGMREMIGTVKEDTTLRLKLVSEKPGPRSYGSFNQAEYEAKQHAPLEGAPEAEKQ
jgi:hypothetical protein